MKKCHICGRKANIYTGERWLCEKHYLLVKKKGNQIHNTTTKHEKTLPQIDLGLTKV